MLRPLLGEEALPACEAWIDDALGTGLQRALDLVSAVDVGGDTLVAFATHRGVDLRKQRGGYLY